MVVVAAVTVQVQVQGDAQVDEWDDTDEGVAFM